MTEHPYDPIEVPPARTRWAWLAIVLWALVLVIGYRIKFAPPHISGTLDVRNGGTAVMNCAAKECIAYDVEKHQYHCEVCFSFPAPPDHKGRR